MGSDERAGSEPLSSDEPAPRGWLLLCVALLVVVGVYLPALGGPFLWDDRHLISDDSGPHRIDVARAFSQPFWVGTPESVASHSYFRPLTTLSLNVDQVVHGDNSAGYHLTNIAAHLVATALLFALIRRRQVSELVAFMLTLAWALLPRLAECAAWISGRGDALAAACAFAALLVWRPSSHARLALAAVLGLAAMWCKESGLATFAALLVLELGGSGSRAKSQAGRLARLLLLLAPLLVYGATRLAAGAGSVGDGLVLGPAMRALMVLEALGRYAFMLADPFQPRSVNGQLGTASWPFVALGGALALAGATALLKRPKLSHETLVWLAFGLTPLLLVLHLTRLPVTAVAADRYLYLPSAGLLLAAAPTLQAAITARRTLLAPLALLLVALAVRSVQRVADYADDARFWTTALVQTPGDMTPPIELGGVAYRSGCLPEALELYSRGARLDSARVSRQLGTVALVANLLGKRELALQASDALIRAYPDSAEMRLRRATLAISSLDWAGARKNAQRALELEPGLQPAQEVLAALPRDERLHAAVVAGAPLAERLALELRTLRYPEAVTTLRALLDDPAANPVALRQGIELVITRGDPADAVPLLERYLSSHRDPDAQRLLAAVQARFDAATNLRARLRDSAIAATAP